MQSVSESKQELEASIRYAENAISSAKATIESMEFRQEMAKKQYAEQTGREQSLQAQVKLLEERISSMQSEMNALEQPEKPTMPVIPKAVAIAIFREGVQHGVSNACDEIDNSNDISIEESGYTGEFEVSFRQCIDLNDHIDTDWMRGKVGDYSEESAIDALKNLCVDKKFECRIHGIDDVEAKDSASS